MEYRRYPNKNRITDRDRIYLDDYLFQMRKDTDILIGSVGDSIKILKNYKIPTHVIDHKGDVNTRGSHGGRRQLQPLQIQDPLSIPANAGEVVNRPQKNNEIFVPAILDLSPSSETRLMYGFKDDETGTVSLSAKYLESRGIEVNPASDYFGIYGEVFKVRLLQDGQKNHYLDSGYVYVYTVKKDM